MRLLLQNRTSVMHKWNFKLVQRVPWLNLNRNKPPMLTALSDRGAIFEGELALSWRREKALHLKADTASALLYIRAATNTRM